MASGKAAQRAKVWREVIRRQQSSGLSIAEFCRREGLAQATFYNWRQKLAADDHGPFLELQLPHLNNAAACEIVLPDCRVVVPPAFDADSLRRLLDVLRQEDEPC
jgi:transposase-like protein